MTRTNQSSAFVARLRLPIGTINRYTKPDAAKQHTNPMTSSASNDKMILQARGKQGNTDLRNDQE
jgi:hypothetical protein